MNLGETISRLRTAAGMSQNQLAEALDVSRQSVSKWETGASVPELDKLMKLAQLFGVSLDELVQGAGLPPETQAASEPAESAAPVPEGEAPALRQTGARQLGAGLLLASVVVGALLMMLLGPAGPLLVLPLVVFGLICWFGQKHPLVKAFWASFLLIDGFLNYATGIRASMVQLTLYWVPEMNYLRLASGWGLFLAELALIGGTAAAFRKDGWTDSPRQKRLLLLSAAGLLITLLPLPINVDFYLDHSLAMSTLYLLRGWIRLASAAALAAALARRYHSYRH